MIAYDYDKLYQSPMKMRIATDLEVAKNKI